MNLDLFWECEFEEEITEKPSDLQKEENGEDESLTHKSQQLFFKQGRNFFHKTAKLSFAVYMVGSTELQLHYSNLKDVKITT